MNVERLFRKMILSKGFFMLDVQSLTMVDLAILTSAVPRESNWTGSR